MCICQDVGSQKPLKITIIHTDSTFHWFYALNFRQTPAITEISRTQVHAGTPHMFCHTTTAIACVSVKMWPVKNRSKSRLYTRTRHFTGLIRQDVASQKSKNIALCSHGLDISLV